VLFVLLLLLNSKLLRKVAKKAKLSKLLLSKLIA
jgi:hypothetical protein